MRSGVNDDIVLAKLLRQDRALVVLGISAMTLLGWAYLFYQDWGMRHMDLVSVRKQPARLLVYCCSVARVNACSVTVAREIALRNKIPELPASG